MFFKIIYIFLFANFAFSRHLPRFSDLDEEDQHLYRVAYETPAYDHDEYQENDDLAVGKLDLLKDGLWAIKAKLKELKAFNKALCASLLTTKLKVKELMANSIALKKHHHIEVDKKKPTYNYQTPSYSQSATYPQYSPQPQYNPQPQYSPQPQYGQQHQYNQPQYNPEYSEQQYIPQNTHDPYYGH